MGDSVVVTQALAGFTLLVLQAAPQAPAAPAPERKLPAQEISLEPLAKGEAARALDSSLSFAELDELLIARRAMGATGRDALKHLLKTQLLARLAIESKVVITPEELEAKSKEIEARIVAAGEAKNLAQYLERTGVAADVFREHLRLAMVQALLAKRALGIPEDQEINDEKQEMWLNQLLDQRGAQLPPPPWTDGIAARCGDLQVKATEFLEYLHFLLPEDDVREDCFQLLLQRRARARMPDLSNEALAKAVEVELDRRRRETERDKRYGGMSYEQLMAAQGLAPGFLPRDPAIVIAALATLWVDRSMGDKGLRAAYAKERESFDGRFGEAIDTHMILLRAAELPNQLIPRDFPAADRELSTMKASIKSFEDFAKLARERSEETSTKETSGHLGFVTRADERLPAAVRDALFLAKPGADGTAVAGPVRIQGGVCLFWVGVRRPAPSWEEMSVNVHREFRKRFLDEVLPRESLRTYLD